MTFQNFPKRAIQETASLKPEEERELFKIIKNGNPDSLEVQRAKNRITTAYVPMVYSILSKWKSPANRKDDLELAAWEGLAEAMDRFDLEKQVKFGTYAPWWIRAKLADMSVNNHSEVKFGTTTTAKFVFFNYGKAQSKLKPHDPRPMSDRMADALAELYIENQRKKGQEPTTTVRELAAEYKLYCERYPLYDYKMDRPIARDGENTLTFGDFLEDTNTPSQEETLEKKERQTLGETFVKAAKAHLLSKGKEREWDIFESRELSEDPLTLDELGEKYGVSRERIRQIQVRTKEKVHHFATGYFNQAAQPQTEPTEVHKKEKSAQNKKPETAKRQKTKTYYNKKKKQPIFDPNTSGNAIHAIQSAYNDRNLFSKNKERNFSIALEALTTISTQRALAEKYGVSTPYISIITKKIKPIFEEFLSGTTTAQASKKTPEKTGLSAELETAATPEVNGTTITPQNENPADNFFSFIAGKALEPQKIKGIPADAKGRAILLYLDAEYKNAQRPLRDIAKTHNMNQAEAQRYIDLLDPIMEQWETEYDQKQRHELLDMAI